MAISDANLIKFCLQMKQGSNGALGDDGLIRFMDGFVNTDPDLSVLSAEDKQDLFKVLVAHDPNYSPIIYRMYHTNHTGAHRPAFIRSYYVYDPFPIYYPWLFYPSSCHCGHGHSSGSNDSNAMFIMMCIFLALFAIVISVKTAFEIKNNVNSFYHNEGRERSLFNLLAMAGIYTTCAVIGATYVFSALVSFSPYWAAALATAAITIISAYGIYWLVDILVDVISPKSNINPKNPYANFTMTQTEQDNLAVKGIDPILARAAIVFINSDIKTTTRHTLWGDTDSEDRRRVELIRAIRRGELEDVNIGSKKYNLRAAQIPTAVYVGERYTKENIPMAEVISLSPF